MSDCTVTFIDDRPLKVMDISHLEESFGGPQKKILSLTFLQTSKNTLMFQVHILGYMWIT